MTRTTTELVEVVREHADPGSPAFLLAARVATLFEALREIDRLAVVPEQDSLIRDSYRAIRRVARVAMQVTL